MIGVAAKHGIRHQQRILIAGLANPEQAAKVLIKRHWHQIGDDAYSLHETSV